MKFHPAYWVSAAILAVAGIVMMGSAFVWRASNPVGETWEDSFGEFKNIDLKAAKGSLRVEMIGAEEECRVAFENMPKQTEAFVEGDTLVIDDNVDGKSAFNLVSFGDFDMEVGKITLYLPEREYGKFELSTGFAMDSSIAGLTCDTFIFNSGVGDVDFKDSTVKGNLELKCGTGDYEMTQVKVGGTTIIDSGVGIFRMDAVELQNHADIDIGTGDCSISHSTLGALDLDGGVGDIDIDSTKLLGDADIDLGTGDITLNLDGSKDDYAISTDNGIGDAEIDGESTGGMLNRDALYELDIDAGVGDVEISFSE